MRKVVNVVGVGKRKQGVSKSGNSYDFVPLSLTFEDSGRVNGLRCCEVNANYAELASAWPDGIAPGDCAEVVMHEDFRRGGFVLDAIL